MACIYILHLYYTTQQYFVFCLPFAFDHITANIYLTISSYDSSFPQHSFKFSIHDYSDIRVIAEIPVILSVSQIWQKNEDYSFPHPDTLPNISALCRIIYSLPRTQNHQEYA